MVHALKEIQPSVPEILTSCRVGTMAGKKEGEEPKKTLYIKTEAIGPREGKKKMETVYYEGEIEFEQTSWYKPTRSRVSLRASSELSREREREQDSVSCFPPSEWLAVMQALQGQLKSFAFSNKQKKTNFCCSTNFLFFEKKERPKRREPVPSLLIADATFFHLENTVLLLVFCSNKRHQAYRLLGEFFKCINVYIE